MKNPVRIPQIKTIAIIGTILFFLVGAAQCIGSENITYPTDTSYDDTKDISQASEMGEQVDGYTEATEPYPPEEDPAGAIDESVDGELDPSAEENPTEGSEEQVEEDVLADEEEECECDADAPYTCNGYLRLLYGYCGVSGDRGRFREDQWINDNSRGGIDWMHVEFFPEEEKGYEMLLEGRAIVDDWYDAYFHARRADGHHYLKSAFTWWRHYYDGSTKFADSEEEHDSDLYLDRRTYLVELGYTQECCPEVIFGWHRLENHGKQTPFYGASNSFGSGPYDILAPIHENGTTDTFYGEIGKTFCCKYNFRLRTEFENYDDDRKGLFSTKSRFDEDPYFRLWRQYVLFDSFLNPCTYVSLNYLFHDVKNTSKRDVFNSSGAVTYKERDVDNTKCSHIGLGRINRKRFLGLCDLTLDARVRGEYSDISLRSTEENEGSRHRGTWKTKGSFDQWRFMESAQLTYKGFCRTTLTAEALWEQRYEDRKWFNDHFDQGELEDAIDRKTDIDVHKQRYTLTAVHRFNRCLKATLRARYNRKVRDYDERVDTTEDDYPGYLGDFLWNEGEFTAKTDLRITPCLFYTLYYKWREETLKTDLGGKVNRRTHHHVAATCSWEATKHFHLTTTGIYEDYRFDTPTNPENCGAWEQGKQNFDFKGNNFTGTLDGIYAFNPNTSTFFGYRHTEAWGGVDFSGNYSYDEIHLGLNRIISCFGEIGLSYCFKHFNDQRKEHDDYEAHCGRITWEHAF
ncbi:MAG: hypothetical protein K940chlam7_00714 [Chlamydiae bacterium]|nr:hypothetical protein [Chlamydiota bacterium]